MKCLPANRLAAALVAAAVALAATPVPAAEPARKPEPLRYTLYAGEGCKAVTFRAVSTHEDSEEACWAADRLRRDGKPARITTGKVEGDMREPSGLSCTVYRRGCKVWGVSASTRGEWEAEVLAEAIRKKGDFAEVVYHYPRP